ncbi:hypothetical protein DERF_003455 [Dermatophagoides farinae]|uniref:Uncharacterized protein n=1 Tax=Dermatophagoides farinae TaxID=6954 RepID=A0A922IH67_DERFA|nr:hypothetical protein DERF_003455 [Dermatophagoides farinae]
MFCHGTVWVSEAFDIHFDNCMNNKKRKELFVGRLIQYIINRIFEIFSPTNLPFVGIHEI